MPLVAGVDSSTTACKVELRDADTGELVASGRAPHPPTTPPRSEQDPHAWWSAFEAAWGQACGGGDARPAAIAVAGQQHGLVVLDEAGAPLRPAPLWNDVRSAPQAAALVAERGEGWWADRFGSVPGASFTVTKWLWLRENEPETAKAAAGVRLHDFLTERLSGAAVTDRGDVSGTPGGRLPTRRTTRSCWARSGSTRRSCPGCWRRARRRG